MQILRKKMRHIYFCHKKKLRPIAYINHGGALGKARRIPRTQNGGLKLSTDPVACKYNKSDARRNKGTDLSNVWITTVDYSGGGNSSSGPILEPPSPGMEEYLA